MRIDKPGIDDIKVFEINEHLLAFYAGRKGTRFMDEYNWIDDGAMKLGIATYAIYKKNRAVIYDTFADIPHAEWVKNYLEHLGINQFTVVLSHWHLDHIAGNEVYKNCSILSNTLTREVLLKNKTAIETGCCEGPPGIKPLFPPNITFDERTNLYLDDLQLELRNVNIHTNDGTVIYIPSDKILLAGDTLEDPITYIDETENLVTHVKNLQKLKQLTLSAILPNHGDPVVIEAGGYDKTIIDAMINYIVRMVSHAHDKDFLMSPMKSFLYDELKHGWVHYYEPYEQVHKENLKKVHDYYKNKQLPSFS